MLERLLLEEYPQDEIDDFRNHIDDCMACITEQLAFRTSVLDAFEKVVLDYPKTRQPSCILFFLNYQKKK